MTRPVAGRDNVLVAVLALAGIVVSLQQTIVIPLVPLFPRLLDASAADATWVVTATLLAAAVATPVVGRLADMVGKRRMLLFCLMVLVVGSTISALSSTLVPLVVGRSLQGLAAGVVPLGISLMRDQLPASRLGSATALMSASLGVGGALGLPLSALLAQVADWHVLFWAAGGLGLVTAVLVVTLVPESPQRAGGRFDLLGAVALSVALICLLLAVSKGGGWGWASPTTLSLFAVAVVALLGWGLWELRTPHPLVDLRISRRRQVLLTNAASAVFGFSMFAMSLVFPQLLQLPAETGYGLGQSIVVAGLILAPGGLCMMAMSPVSARISAASGPRTTLMVGAAVVAAGYLLGAAFHSAVWHLLLSSVVISSGVGLAYGAMPSLVMAAVPVTQTAAANSLNNLMRAIGTSTASAVTGVLLARITVSTGGSAVPTEAAFVLAMLLGSATALVALVITGFIPRRPEATPPAAAPADEAPADALVRGVVRTAGAAVPDAVVSVVGHGGVLLGRSRSGPDGTYAVPAAEPGASQLLVVQRDGLSHAEHLTGAGPHHRDVQLHPADRPERTDGPAVTPVMPFAEALSANGRHRG
ncbi:Major Facilitator Superfamily protein [Pseudonocardia ammonioxydans]|uniref:Major Facilitator Superfamily protein n=1 Tax=Pseudonocardia ammonioxydans TaxID=260086 RepID=A0A1I4X870_PSUAM|nr:MFS transporter [Pseudonocardia ammonioxydans]SFN21882.1 Major Facilitator Superfamily protein [Pseudonocardia ammonioxydans]